MIKTYRQSIINAWVLCPERVRRRYIENEVIPPGIAARIGTGVHCGAEVNHLAKIQTGEDEPLDVVQDAARDGYVEAIRNGVFFAPEEMPSARKQVAAGTDQVVQLAGLYHQSLAPLVMPALVEKKIEMDLPELGTRVSGIVDVLDENHWLPDIKTAARKWPESKAHSSVQATLYDKLVEHYTGRRPTKISFEVFTKTKVPNHQSLVTTRQPDDWDALLVRIKVIKASVDAGIFPPADPSSWTCNQKWCGFWWTCPYIAAHRKVMPKRTI
jgi:hypothetical protein